MLPIAPLHPFYTSTTMPIVLLYIYFLNIYLFKKIFLFTWIILKSLLNLLQHCLCCLCSSFFHGGMWDPGSPTRDQTHTSCIGKQSL